MGLIAAIDDCDRRDDVRVVVLTGAGRGFCAGGDVHAMGAEADNRPHVTKKHIVDYIQAFPQRLATFNKPIIAAVNGVATGGGMDLALACDFRTAAKSARFAETYAKIGLLPGGGGAYHLPRIVGTAKLPPYSVTMIKRTVYQGLNSELASALENVGSHIAIAKASGDHAEAIKAFHEKRAGDYSGS